MTIEINKYLFYTWLFLAICNLIYYVLPVSPFMIRLAWLGIIIIGIFTNLNKGFTRVDCAILLFEGVVLSSFIFNNESNEISFTNLANTSISLLSFVFLGKTGDIRNFRSHVFIPFIVALFLAAIMSYYFKMAETIARFVTNDSEAITINASTIFLMLFPIAFILKNKILTFSITLICIFFVLTSVKRGNILALFIPSILFFWCELKDTRMTYQKKTLIFLAIIALGLWISNFIEHNAFFQQRIEDTVNAKSSGRDTLYSTYFNMWYLKASVFQWLFGYGYEGTLIYGGLGKFAHNDWLEILVDFGLIGFIAYLNIFLCLVKFTFRIGNRRMKYLLIAIVYIWLVKSMISMGFMSESLAYLGISYSYAVACIKRKYQTKTQKVRLQDTESQLYGLEVSQNQV